MDYSHQPLRSGPGRRPRAVTALAGRWEKPFTVPLTNCRGAAQIRSDIRAEKEMWDYWQTRVTVTCSYAGKGAVRYAW